MAWKCARCNGTDIEVRAWIQPNNDNRLADFETKLMTPTGYCLDCDTKVDIWRDRLASWNIKRGSKLDPRTFQDLHEMVLTWAWDKGIIQSGKPMTQAIKTLEEVHELIEAINKDDQEAIHDAIGDIIVTLVSQAWMQGTTVRACLALAYDEIKGRTGHLDETGNFIKDQEEGNNEKE